MDTNDILLMKDLFTRRQLLDEYINKLQEVEEQRRAYKMSIKICKAQIKNLENKFYGL